MTLLTVAQRELLAAARRPATFRVRIGSALLAAVFAVVVLVFITVSGAGGQSGQFLFSALWWGVQWFAILAGTFLTADAISEERRDGTLGLLFLTDIDGFELVVGKFLGAGLNAAYGMAAVFPIMATAWFLGGITNGEFWRALLVSLNTLFVSLALGLCVSAVSREQNRAVGITVAIQLLVQLALPAGATLARALAASGRLPAGLPLDAIDWISPAGVALRSREFAYARAPGDFWGALGTSHAAGWFLLAGAGFLVVRSWREGGAPNRIGAVFSRIATRLEQGRPHRWTPPEVDRNPLAALFRRGRGSALLAWIAAGVVAVAAIGIVVSATLAGTAYTRAQTATFSAVTGVMFTLFRALVAWEATAFFGEARRTGALELALTTPLTDDAIRSGHSRHLRSMFLGPLGVLCCTNVLGAMAGGGLGPMEVIASVGLLLQFWSMISVGAWLSLAERRTLVATAKTLVFCGLLPALLGYCCIGLVIPPILRFWADGKLRMPLRQILTGARAPWQIVVPRP